MTIIDRASVLQNYIAGLAGGDVFGFFHEHRALSNFHVEQFKWNGVCWPSAENAYQAVKKYAPDRAHMLEFAAMKPGDAKFAGKAIRPLRADWEAEKLKIMEEILRAKFDQCPYACRVLRATADGVLEECNWWHDEFWGTYGGKGQNHLGRILMAIRAQFDTVVAPPMPNYDDET